MTPRRPHPHQRHPLQRHPLQRHPLQRHLIRWHLIRRPLRLPGLLTLGALGSALSAGAQQAGAPGGVAHPDTGPRAAPVWPVPGPPPLPGSLLPERRIVAFYGNPLSTRMGILGELPPQQMLAQLDREVAAWRAADPSTPVQPALHLIAIVAQADAGRDGKHRAKMADTLIERVYGWAGQRDAVLFLDVQVGLSTIQAEAPRLERFLQRPDVHLGIDPEFAMRDGIAPGRRVGSYDAEEINWVIDYLAALVTAHNLPPKVLVIHRYTQRMVRGHDRIRRDPRVQVVMHMDGWGPPHLKRDTYNAYITREPVQFTGFKVFYKHNTHHNNTLMSPADILRLWPRPLYIQYQ
jgi:hypothetical protein